MVSARWSKEETAVLMYFASRNADHEACSTIIAWKCSSEHPRSATAIRMKLDDIRLNNDSLWSQTNGWDRGKVDEWLIRLDLSNLDTLVEVGFEELQAVNANNRKTFMDAVYAPTTLPSKETIANDEVGQRVAKE